MEQARQVQVAAKGVGQTHTIVVEFPEGVSPSYFAGMQVLGGTVAQVAFDGNRLDVADELLDVLQSFPGFTDDATRGDEWIERMRSAIAKATGASA